MVRVQVQVLFNFPICAHKHSDFKLASSKSFHPALFLGLKQKINQQLFTLFFPYSLFCQQNHNRISAALRPVLIGWFMALWVGNWMMTVGQNTREQWLMAAAAVSKMYVAILLCMSVYASVDLQEATMKGIPSYDWQAPSTTCQAQDSPARLSAPWGPEVCELQVGEGNASTTMSNKPEVIQYWREVGKHCSLERQLKDFRGLDDRTPMEPQQPWQKCSPVRTNQPKFAAANERTAISCKSLCIWARVCDSWEQSDKESPRSSITEHIYTRGTTESHDEAEASTQQPADQTQSALGDVEQMPPSWAGGIGRFISL